MNTGTTRERTIMVGVLAGLGGGVAEIAWVAAYSSAAGFNALAVAREVAASVAPSTAGPSAAPLLGIAIHLLLAMAIGAVFSLTFAAVVSGRFRGIGMIVPAIATLLVVWAFNFFVLLPVLHPPFVTLMPLAATFVSKLLFGMTMGWIVQAYTIAPSAVTPEHLSLSRLQQRNPA